MIEALLAHLTLRAIESRVAIVRAANTGISGWVDPLGRVRAATPLDQRRAEAYDVQTSDVRTLYDALGDFVGLLSTAAAIALVAFDWSKRRQERVARG